MAGVGVEPTEVHRAKSTLKENFSNYYLALGPKPVISNTYSRKAVCKRLPSCPRQEGQGSSRSQLLGLQYSLNCTSLKT